MSSTLGSNDTMRIRLNCCIAVISMAELIYIHVGSTVWELWRPNLVVTSGNLTPDQLTTCYTCGRPGWSRKANAAQPCTSCKITSFKLFSGPEIMRHCKKKKKEKEKRQPFQQCETEANTFCQTLFYFKSNVLEFRVNTPKMCHWLPRTFPVPMKIHTETGRRLVIRSKLRTCLLTTEPPWHPGEVWEENYKLANLKSNHLDKQLIGVFIYVL